jgi:hypothetical protein
VELAIGPGRSGAASPRPGLLLVPPLVDRAALGWVVLGELGLAAVGHAGSSLAEGAHHRIGAGGAASAVAQHSHARMVSLTQAGQTLLGWLCPAGRLTVAASPVGPALYRTTLRGNQGRLRSPPKVRHERGCADGAIARSAPLSTAAPLPEGAMPTRLPTGSSGRGGRSNGRLSGTLRRPPPSESHRRRPLLVPPRSHDPYPAALCSTSRLVPACSKSVWPRQGQVRRVA